MSADQELLVSVNNLDWKSYILKADLEEFLIRHLLTIDGFILLVLVGLQPLSLVSVPVLYVKLNLKFYIAIVVVGEVAPKEAQDLHFPSGHKIN